MSDSSNESFTCYKCNLTFELIHKCKHYNLCRSCKKIMSAEERQANKMKNQNNWIRPELARCSTCKESINSKLFNINACTRNGLQSCCKYHETIYNLKRRNEGKKRILTMELTKEQFFKLLMLPCYYCGTNENIGVDRVFNEKPYSKLNCVSCCGTCNKMKGPLDGDVFLKLVQNIQRHQDMQETQDSIESNI